MMVVYDKPTNDFVGLAAKVCDNGNWREPTLEEIYPNRDRSDLGFFYVKDSPKYALRPDIWQLKLDENGVPIGIERKPTPPQIYITTNAVDNDGDGIPELIADGNSKASIAIEVKNPEGELVKEKVALNLRTTGGALSARRVITDTGQATVELTSSLETVSIVVEASAEGVAGGSLELEFMPPVK